MEKKRKSNRTLLSNEDKENHQEIAPDDPF